MDRVTGAEAASVLSAAVAEHRAALDAVEALGADLGRAADAVAEAFASGGRLLLCGNGGSAADAQHIAAEFVGRYLKERAPFSAIALHANTSALTAIGNDYGFDEVFARQVRAHGRAGDVLLAISTSGKSPNVLRAIDAAREVGMTVIGLSGGDGGPMAAVCDVCLTAPAASTPRIQELHILIAHVLCGLVEDALS
jgi:D-sedoheptulose 7-phosphate isomerase